MSETALISIIMPVKNAASYLHECLDSILHQSYDHWELMAVDDHSSDDSFLILQEYCNRDSRIRTLQLVEGEIGIIPALQLAYHNSVGVYITRMDADDIMRKDKLYLLSEALRSKGQGHVSVGLVSYFCKEGIGDGYQKYAQWLNDLTAAESNFSEIYKECVIPSPCWMMSRSDFEMIGAFNSDLYPEDYDLCFRMRNNNLKITGINQVLHDWRDHPFRASRNDPNYVDNRFLNLKVDHFINQDLKADSNLVLWGAGKKGKNIAKLLIERSIPFQWYTNNANKIGHDIYGLVLKPDSALESLSCKKVIMAISAPRDRRMAIDKMKSERLQLGVDYFPFC